MLRRHTVNHGGQVRLITAVGDQHPLQEHSVAEEVLQQRLKRTVEDPLQLGRDTRQAHKHRPALPQRNARGRADGIVQRFRSLRQVGHLPPLLGERRVQHQPYIGELLVRRLHHRQRPLVEFQWTAHRRSQRRQRQIVGGGAEAAGQDDEIRLAAKRRL